MKRATNKRWLPWTLIWGSAIIAFAAITIPSIKAQRSLGEPDIITGYSLFAIMVLLLIYNVRKRLSMLPLGRAHWWTLIHSVFGVLATALFFVHTETIWPYGPYEQMMTGLFYVAILSGVFGYVIQRLYPVRLTGKGTEVIFERIPVELADLRDQAESAVLRCTKETKSDTLARYYVETFEWFFRAPRFQISHLTGADKSDHWLDHQFSNSKQYLNEQEQSFLNEIRELAEEKNRVDFHHAAQRLMKGWLLVHVPSVIGLMALSLWHLLIVNIYGI